MARKSKKSINREVKIVGAEEVPKKIKVSVKHEKVPPTFDMWWSMKRNKLNLDDKIKEIIRIHFESRGFMKNKKFDEGLEDFGIKA